MAKAKKITRVYGSTNISPKLRKPWVEAKVRTHMVGNGVTRSVSETPKSGYVQFEPYSGKVERNGDGVLIPNEKDVERKSCVIRGVYSTDDPEEICFLDAKAGFSKYSDKHPAPDVKDGPTPVKPKPGKYFVLDTILG